MKNKLIPTLLLLPLLLVGCNSNASSSEAQILPPSADLSNVDENVKHIYNLFRELDNGFTFNGNVVQSEYTQSKSADGSWQTNQRRSQSYDIETKFEVGERIGTEIGTYGRLPNSDLRPVIDYFKAYEDEDGYCYDEYLDYKNNINRRYIYEANNKLDFTSAGLYNFSTIFNEQDFTYDKMHKNFDVNKDKVSIVLKNLYARVNMGFYYPVREAKIYLDDEGKLDKMTISMLIYYRYQNTVVRQAYENECVFKFLDIGTTKLDRTTKYAPKVENHDLSLALNNVKDNFTLNITSNISTNDAAPVTNYQTIKFDGEKILVQYYRNLKQRDKLTPENHYILKEKENTLSDALYSYVMVDQKENLYEKKSHQYFARNYQGAYIYEDLLPSPSSVSVDFFEYDNKINEYIFGGNDIVYELVPFFSVNKRPIVDPNISHAQQIGIRLTSDNHLDYVKYYVRYNDFMSGIKLEGTIRVDYTNIGSTVI